MITLDSFRVIHKLSVKNIEIHPNQVKAIYSVEKTDGYVSQTELIYSYEGHYFNKANAEDINLASMILSQVALNYGLFCEVIEFDGLYDAIDQQFIRQMMENTSREIITNKLLVKNEFLKPPFNHLQIERRESYTQAEIRFINSKFSDLKLSSASQKVDVSKYAILSSGGKDSLLTYGIIREIGEPHPIFINESGRHWFTAVNSYRSFKQNEPNTQKPWTNSDRVFNWMLKQFPFIKENYANIRADIYPIRLWTVAVFLFGVLPIVRKKGIGNILVGDEYDTTEKSTLSGISHYNGLYDQSRYFDNYLTRYFYRKKWNINQYSLLRHLSELLIMKVLIKRYPELQKNQMSCHSAHEKDGRMYPCGKCEKCRRIIGMIKALDENPENCGFNQEQIMEGLLALARKSVKQIGSDAAHLYFILLTKNLIEENEFTQRLAKEHPEIMKIRIHSERNSLEDLPQYIREPMFEILLHYAEGVVKRQDRAWIPFELNDEYLRTTKYKFHEE